jgi:hypothetical protein
LDRLEDQVNDRQSKGERLEQIIDVLGKLKKEKRYY